MGIKTKQEIQLMREGGKILSRALQAAIDAVAPGVKVCDLDAIAKQALLDAGATPSFLGYKNSSGIPFPSTMCVSINEEVVHGSGARDRKLKSGDLVSLDIGCWYKGLCTDMSATVAVGRFSKLPKKSKALLETTRGCLITGIEAVKVGGSVKDISRAIETLAHEGRFGIVRALVGHGVGHAVHENPNIPNYVSIQFPDVKLVEGMCLAIEPMLTLGGDDVETADDGWSIITSDGSLSAHFELTIAVTKSGAEIITPPPEVGF